MHNTSSRRSRYGLIGLLIVLGMMIVAACGERSEPPQALANVAGNHANGQTIFNQQCVACHTPTTRRSIGPGLAGMFEPGGPVLPDGVDYGGKLPNGEAITTDSVAAWIENGGRGEIGLMPPQNLSRQEIADVVAYIATLNKE
jgi:cytochrome c